MSDSPTAKNTNLHFLLRRLHSLSGIMPVGIFVIFHLFTNAQMILPGKFQHEVEFIHDLPALLFIEIFGLWLPIAFHAILGVFYMTGIAPNTISYAYRDNWRYTLQRVTAWGALIFIFLHIATLRWGWNIFGWETPFYVHAQLYDGTVVATNEDGEPLGLAKASTALAIQSSVLVLVLYTLGAASVVFHWANGLWTAAISWGLTITVQAQKRWGQICFGLGVALAIFSAVAIYASYTYELTPEEEAAMAAIMAHRAGDHAEPPAELILEPDATGPPETPAH